MTRFTFFRMLRLISSLLVFSALSAAFPFPIPAAPVIPPLPVIPTKFPFVPGATPIIPGAVPFAPVARPALPGLSNPYYNYAGGPAVPIVTYSSEHGLDGTYAFRYVKPSNSEYVKCKLCHFRDSMTF